MDYQPGANGDDVTLLGGGRQGIDQRSSALATLRQGAASPHAPPPPPPHPVRREAVM